MPFWLIMVVAMVEDALTLVVVTSIMTAEEHRICVFAQAVRNIFSP